MTTASRKIVIVEDEPNAADVFEEMMRVSGYQVVKIHSSSAAMSVIRAELPDAILLDIMMPDISGIEVLRFMRREPSLKHIPVVIVSARTLPSDIRAGMEAGATAYLTKPVGFQELRETVAEVIRAAESLNAEQKTEDASDG
jgi:two-component system phosphate regulon response regulator PhoB